MKKEHEILFTPYRLGGVELKNRYAMVAMGTGGMVTQENTFNQRGMEYYVERAKGGAGLIITGTLYAENEIEKSEFVKITNNRIEIFANYENLEYYIRCSMFAYAQQKTVIVIHIDRSDAHFDEIMYIAESFASRHGNVRCELI